MRADLEVPAEQLRGRVDEAEFRFETTAELDGPEDPARRAMLFQPRAQAAFELAMAAKADGFHVFASGAAGMGKAGAALASLRAEAARRPAADDQVFVFDFARPGRPRALRLPAGQAEKFAKDLDGVIETLRWEVPRLLVSQAFRRRHADLALYARQMHRKALADLAERIEPLGFRVVRRPGGFEAVPAPGSRGRTPAARRRKLEDRVSEVADLADQTARAIQALELEVLRRHRALEREVVAAQVDRLLAPLLAGAAGREPVQDHLKALKEDVLTQLELFKVQSDPTERPAFPPGLMVEANPFLRYRVNVLVNRAGERCAPVVFEVHPTFPNLFGRIDRKVELGTLTTDFTLLKAGALHRANGGFLVLDAMDVLTSVGSWEGLKRCLRSKAIFLEDLSSMLGLTPVEVLQPEPIPLGCRVVLVGEMSLYELLYRLDPDFREIFQVRADFDDSVLASGDNRETYARVIAATCAKEGLLPLDRGAVARLIEHAMRLAEDQQRLSVLWDRIRELLAEADHWARRDGADRIRAAHLKRAEEQRRFRGNLVEEWTREEIRRGVLIVHASGLAVGEVNGLAVGEVGDLVVGRPVRISARVGPGAEGVVDVERRAQLGGRVHSKAVMILQGFLIGRFASDAPLALEATLTFEQSYGEIEGDSASIAELTVLMSALSGVPVRQGVAVTGSLSQDGQAQPVGAVTRKVEAFFDACCELGLDDSQGVVLAASNVQHLNLREDVCAAVAAGHFHIWGVRSADEALEILLGQPMGERRADGTWPEGTVNALVAHRLEQMSRAVRHLPPRRGALFPARARPPREEIPGEPPVPPVHSNK